ncbi:MAG: glycoside hydrolase family 125 protein [Christensenellales bacterium]
MPAYQVTGNEYVSLPAIREDTGAVQGLTVLHMGAKGLLELCGGDAPLIAPVVRVAGQEAMLAKLRWRRENAWVPVAQGEAQGLTVTLTYLCPLGERAFFVRLEAENRRDVPLEVWLGVRGQWTRTLHEVNETIALDGRRTQEASGWNNAFVMQEVAGLPLCAFAPIAEARVKWTWGDMAFEGGCGVSLAPGGHACVELIFGVGVETVAAATSAKHLLRLGYERCLRQTLGWLKKRMLPARDATVARMMNENLFFSFFFASGRTLDTEEMCLMTSRSPRYYVSAAYWDRDSLLWSFPAIVLTDAAYAREILMHVFTRQIRNVGQHSRYIDGTLLEPGFELDELCAPVLALEGYLARTGDPALLQEPCVKSGLFRILSVLETKRHPEIELYETFLQPTDDEIVYPYLTYDNALVWRVLLLLSEWLERPDLARRAGGVKAAVYRYCVREGQFVWSTDLEGHYDIYDEPPGSLQLLPHYGFCAMDDPVWQSTVRAIRSEAYPLSFAGRPIAEIGCRHAPHPWVLSICNSLLCGHTDTALAHLARTRMDNGLACESVNEDTGECETGAAFATCAGFLAYALWSAAR